MELSQIRYFTATAQKMHFAAAAESLGVTQSALSRGIQKLEKELGFPLFIRKNKRNILLSASGKAFLPHAQKALTHLEAARRNGADAARGTRGHLVVGALASALERKTFRDVLREMQLKFPDVALEIIDDHSEGLTEGILNHRLHVAITRKSEIPDADDELIRAPLFNDELLLAMPKNHPLAKKKTLSVADLAQSRIITVPRHTSPAFYDAVEALCLEKGKFHLHAAEECSNFYTALHLVQMLGGVTFVPASHRKVFSDRITFRETAERLKVPVYAVYRRDEETPALKNFLSLLAAGFTAALPDSGSCLQ